MNVTSIARRLGLAGAIAATVNQLAAYRAETDHPVTGRLVDVGGTRLHVVVRGSGLQVLLLHGNGGMIEEVEATGIPDQLSANHTVIIPDRPGFGRSRRPREIVWTPERQANVLEKMLEAVAAPQAVIVAHSWATMIAAAMAISNPQAVAGLVLVSGYYYPTLRFDKALGMLSAPVVGDALRHTVAPLAGRVMAAPVIAKLFAPGQPTESFNRHYPLEMALRPTQLRAVGEEAAIMQESAQRLHRRYREIQCPVMIVAGSADRFVDTDQQSVRLARDIPHAGLHIIAGAGHMIPHVASAAVLAAIGRIVAAIGSSPSPAQGTAEIAGA